MGSIVGCNVAFTHVSYEGSKDHGVQTTLSPSEGYPRCGYYDAGFP